MRVGRSKQGEVTSLDPWWAPAFDRWTRSSRQAPARRRSRQLSRAHLRPANPPGHAVKSPFRRQLASIASGGQRHSRAYRNGVPGGRQARRGSDRVRKATRGRATVASGAHKGWRRWGGCPPVCERPRLRWFHGCYRTTMTNGVPPVMRWRGKPGSEAQYARALGRWGVGQGAGAV